MNVKTEPSEIAFGQFSIKYLLPSDLQHLNRNSYKGFIMDSSYNCPGKAAHFE